MSASCFECKAPPPLHYHHVVPQSAGGTKTVPLCESCHSLVHGKDMRISALTSAALTSKKAKGEQVSSEAPIGYRHEAGRLVMDEKEQATLEFIRAERSRKASLRAITAKLNADLDRFTPRGRTWHLPTVARLVRAMASTRTTASSP